MREWRVWWQVQMRCLWEAGPGGERKRRGRGGLRGDMRLMGLAFFDAVVE